MRLCTFTKGGWQNNYSCGLEFCASIERREAWYEIQWNYPGKYGREKFTDFSKAVDRFNKLEKMLDGMYEAEQKDLDNEL